MIHQPGNWLNSIGQAMSRLTVGLTLLGALDVLNHPSLDSTQRQQKNAVVESPTVQALRTARESATSALQEGIWVGGGRFTLSVTSSKVSVGWLLAL